MIRSYRLVRQVLASREPRQRQVLEMAQINEVLLEMGSAPGDWRPDLHRGCVSICPGVVGDERQGHLPLFRLTAAIARIKRHSQGSINRNPVVTEHKDSTQQARLGLRLELR